MTGTAVVIGSGKTARDIGTLFHQRGYKVTWLVGPSFEHEMTAFVHKKFKTLVDNEGPPPPRVLKRGAPLPGTPDVVLESRVEDRAAKKAAFESVRPYISDPTLLLSNSSSILPDEIGPNISGMHFFYPAALTGFAELVFPDDLPAAVRQRALAFADSLVLEVLCQDARNAFFVNRLLLPLQAESLRLFLLGADAAELDNAAASVFLPAGPFRMADEIGIDVLASGVTNYVDRMPSDVARDFAPLIAALTAWRNAGILGKKNKRRLTKLKETELRGPLAQIHITAHPLPTNVRNHFLYLFLNTCMQFLSRSICTPDTLAAALSAVYGAERTPSEVLDEIGPENLLKEMAQFHETTGISYFEPTRFSLTHAP